MDDAAPRVPPDQRPHPAHPVAAQFSQFARAVNAFVSTPAATFAAFFVVLAWAVSGPAFRFSDGWQLIINTGTTIVTFLMVFVLNNAQSRDTAAMNSKLDAIILALENADNRLIGLEAQSDDEAAELRAHIRESIDGAAHEVVHADASAQ
jgi:low affinity Fe/Cu permease